MIKLFIDFIQFLIAVAPLFSSIAILTLVAILLSKSIKKHATVYYIVLAIPFLLVVIPFFGRMLGVEMFDFFKIPFLGSILKDYIYMGKFGFPLLVIIMYIGALNPKNSNVKKILSIRKELSIISGFPILTHAVIRVTKYFPKGLSFFIENESYMASTNAASKLASGITSFSYVLGILMLALFIPLWITSFSFIRNRMGSQKWKKLQRWSYLLYAMLFIHAVGLQVGSLLETRERNISKTEVQITAAKTNMQHDNNERMRLQGSAEKNEHSDKKIPQIENKQKVKTETAISTDNKHLKIQNFSDIKVSPNAKRILHIITLFLIFGSYLYLRLRKAQNDAKKRKK